MYIPTTTLTQGGGGDFELIYDSLLGADAAAFDITGIPATYSHLYLQGQARGAGGAAGVVYVRFNNDGSAIYDYQFIQAQGMSGGGDINPVNQAAVAQTQGFLSGLTNSGHAAGLAASFATEFPNYSETAFHKQFTSRASMSLGTTLTSQFSQWFGGKWRSTAAINRITILPDSGNFLAGSRVSLYGLG